MSDLYDRLHRIEHVMNHGDLDRALEMLQELSKDHPSNYHVASLLGECYLSNGNPEKAIKPLKWATHLLAEQPQLAEMPEAPASEQGQEEALTVNRLKRSFNRKQPKNLWVDHYLLGCAYGRCLNFRNAIRHLNIADKMNPDNTEILRNLGWIRCMQEKKERGRQLLRRAITLDPENALAYNDLGASYMFDEDLIEAQRWISKAIEMDPEDEFIISTAERLEELLGLEVIFGKKTTPKSTT